MSGGRPNPPTPGPVARWLLERRVAPVQRAQLLDELSELYEHRLDQMGREHADAWMKREYRRLAILLATGGRIEGPTGMIAHPAGLRWQGWPQDIRQSFRSLARTPLFTAALIATVGIGIGGTTLVFSIVDSVMIAPLPYPGGDRTVLLRTIQGEDSWSTSMADLHALRETPPDAFEEIAAFTRRTTRVTTGTEVELVNTRWVTPNYFPLLGVDPVAGRHFLPSEEAPGAPSGVLVTAAYSQRTFGGEGAVGRTLLINGEPLPIVGVLPNELGPIDRGIEVFPLLKVELPPRKGPFFFTTVARLRPGADPALAQEQLRAVSTRIFPLWQDSFTQEGAILGFVDLKEQLVGDVSGTLKVILGAVGFLLLIASANAAGLLLARGVTRQRELAVRTALGASAGRVTRLLLTEAMVVAGTAAVMGLAVASIGTEVVRRYGVGHLPRVDEIGLGPSTWFFLLATTGASWLLFGVVAGVSIARASTRGVANSGATRSTSSRKLVLLRRALVGFQFAVTVPLLVGATLLVASLNQVQTEGYGFDPEGVVAIPVTLPSESFDSQDEMLAFWSNTLAEIEAMPGVLSAGLADARPPIAVGGQNNFVLEDKPVRPGDPHLSAPWITADPGFFETLGVRLLEGRLYPSTPVDTMRHAVVDEAWVAEFFPEGSPVGRRFRSGGCTIDGCSWSEIVGVVSNVKTSGLDDTRQLGTIYYDFARDTYSSMYLHVRTQGEPLSVVPAVRTIIREQDASIPVGEARAIEELATESIAGRRYTSTLVALLASIALVLSLVGIYGVMAYYVRQHNRDIGIRIALGGGPGGAIRTVVARGMFVAGVGALAGLASIPFLGRWMEGLLYGVSANDPRILAGVTLVTLAIAFAATAVPGRQAALTDPAITLRED